jgi:hypothetical protein
MGAACLGQAVPSFLAIEVEICVTNRDDTRNSTIRIIKNGSSFNDDLAATNARRKKCTPKAWRISGRWN